MDHEHHDGHLKPARFGSETLFSYDVIGAPLLVRTDALRGARGPRRDDRARRGPRPRPAAVRAHRVDRPRRRGAAQSDPRPTRRTPSTRRPPRSRSSPRRSTRLGATAVVGAGEVLPSVRSPWHRRAPRRRRDRDPDEGPPGPAPGLPRLGRAAHHLSQLLDHDLRQRLDRGARPSRGWRRRPTPSSPAPARSTTRRSSTEASRTPTPTSSSPSTTTRRSRPRTGSSASSGCARCPASARSGSSSSIPTGDSSTKGSGSSPCPCTSAATSTTTSRDRWLTSTRDAAAVTGACQIVRTEAWRELGGLDERLAVAFNDVDFGMRMCEAGWRVVYTPEVVLGHRESASRGDLHPPADEALLIARWDLLGDYVDPSMPPAIRQYTTRDRARRAGTRPLSSRPRSIPRGEVPPQGFAKTRRSRSLPSRSVTVASPSRSPARRAVERDGGRVARDDVEHRDAAEPACVADRDVEELTGDPAPPCPRRHHEPRDEAEALGREPEGVHGELDRRWRRARAEHDVANEVRPVESPPRHRARRRAPRTRRGRRRRGRRGTRRGGGSRSASATHASRSSGVRARTRGGRSGAGIGASMARGRPHPRLAPRRRVSFVATILGRGCPRRDGWRVVRAEL